MTSSRRLLVTSLGAILLLPPAAVLAQTPDQSAIAAAVVDLHQAILAADPARLAAVSADTLTYGHSAGRIENKAQFIDQLVSRRSVYRSIAVSDQVILVSGDVATVRHNLAVETENAGRVVPSRLGVLLVWQRQSDRWRLIARQSIALPN